MEELSYKSDRIWPELKNVPLDDIRKSIEELQIIYDSLQKLGLDSSIITKIARQMYMMSIEVSEYRRFTEDKPR